jgi:3-isopropylmalate dehydrogenase
MDYKIAVLAGDGIGPEITDAAIKVLNKTGVKYGHTFTFNQLLAGGIAIDKTGNPLPDETVIECKKSDSVLLGAVGGPKWDTLPGDIRPEKGLLKIRAELGLYANIRPAKLFQSLKGACPLRADTAEKGIDIIVVRELTGGIYFGERGIREINGETAAYDTEQYSVSEITRITKIAFEIAKNRKKQVISIDKANVLESSRLWRKVVHDVAKEYPEITVTDMLVDNAAMQLVKNPSQFDVILTSNIFGDILSDEAAMITGSIGMLASSSLGDTTRGLYEPIHGSAPDIAGQDLANPIATILSCAMMLRDSFKLINEAKNIEKAIAEVLDENYRTADIMSEGKIKVSGSKMTELILSKI